MGEISNRFFKFLICVDILISFFARGNSLNRKICARNLDPAIIKMKNTILGEKDAKTIEKIILKFRRIVSINDSIKIFPLKNYIK